MSKPTSSHAYGIGIITVIVGISAGLAYYQIFYLPESLAKPSVSEEILEPIEEKLIEIIPNSADSTQQDTVTPQIKADSVNFEIDKERTIGTSDLTKP